MAKRFSVLRPRSCVVSISRCDILFSSARTLFVSSAPAAELIGDVYYATFSGAFSWRGLGEPDVLHGQRGSLTGLS